MIVIGAGHIAAGEQHVTWQRERRHDTTRCCLSKTLRLRLFLWRSADLFEVAGFVVEDDVPQ
jgi:hypothetical protein